MSRVCILTDTTAQFPHPGFLGNELVTVIPMPVNLRGQNYKDGREVKINQLPPAAGDELSPQLLPPTIESFRQVLFSLSKNYAEIIVLLLSTNLCPAVERARDAAGSFSLPSKVDILDSQTTSAGLGLLVETAAEAAHNGLPGSEILRLLRVLIPHVYTLFCVQSLSYLAYAGKVDPAQAIVGDMLGLLPFLTLENGRLTPLQKARSTRHLIDVFLEFATEFRTLRHVALLQGLPLSSGEARLIRERLLESMPDTPISEHTLGGPLATLFGPRTLGLVLMERV